MSDYVVMIQDGERIYGRINESKGNGGFLVFFHYEMKEEDHKPGLYKINDLDIKETEGKKFGFIKGQLIEAETIIAEELTIEDKAALASVGYIDSLYSYNEGGTFISVRDPNVLDNVSYMAFKLNGKIQFTRKLKYIDKALTFNMHLSELDKNLNGLALASSRRALSYPVKEKDMLLNEESLMRANLESIIWRKIITGVDKSDFCIAMYNCRFGERFNHELYQEILNYNAETNKEIRDNIAAILGNNSKNDMIKVFKILSFYGLHRLDSLK